MRLKQIREKKGITALQLAKAVGTDKYMISKYENGVCLPTPIMLRRICMFLECEILEVYSENEIYIRPRNLALERRNEHNRANYYNFGCRLPKMCCNLLEQDKLIMLGYTSKKNWLIKQIDTFRQDCEDFENSKKEGRMLWA